jgi:hypothetical protein
MAPLTAAQRGVYNSILDLLYSRDGVVPDNDRAVAHAITIDLRQYRNLKRQLEAAGKLRSQDGFLSANGVRSVLANAQLRSSSARANAQLRWDRQEKANNIKPRPMRTHSKRDAIPISLKDYKETDPKLPLEERLPTATELANLRRLGEIK